MADNLVTANHKYAEAVGADFGPATDEAQAAMLNGFLHSLNVACQRRTETQIAYVVDKLTLESKKLLKEFAAMIEAGEEA